MKRSPIFLIAVGGALSFAGGSGAFELDGGWNIVSMCTPSALIVQNSPMGGIADLFGTENFDLFTGNINVTGGAYSGSFDGPVSGTISVSPAGQVNLTENGGESLTFFVNWSSDFMAGQEVDGPFQEIILAAKQPAGTVLSDIVGNWNVVAMCTPSTIGKTFDMGVLTSLIRNQHFEIIKGAMTVAGDSTFTINFPDESFGGTVAIVGPGVVRATASGEPPVTLFLNEGKDVMIAVAPEPEFNELLIFVKAPAACAQHEIQGRWNLVSFNTPSAIVEQRDGMGQLIGIFNTMNFEADFGHAQLRDSGSLTGAIGSEPDFNGSIVLAAPGRATVSVAGDTPFTICGNVNKDVFVGVNADGSFHELLVAVRGIKPTGLFPRVLHGTGEISLSWVGTPTRRLQTLTLDPPTWTDVPGTLGQSETTLPAANDPTLLRVGDN